MNCIGPVTPEDFELLAYADGEASPEVATHLLNCPGCRQRAEDARRELAMWQAALYRAGCPSALELGEYSSGLLTPLRAAEIAEHFRLCRNCASEMAMLTTFLERVRDSRLEEGAAEVDAALRRIKARLSGSAAGTYPGVSTALAKALRGTRGPYIGDSRPFTYDAEDFHVSIEFLPEETSATRQVVGLVASARDLGGAEVELLPRADAPRLATVDEFGSFSLARVPVGSHGLLVRLPTYGVELEIEELDVR